MLCIVTKFIGPTNTKPARVQATIKTYSEGAKRFTVGWHSAECKPGQDPHDIAAQLAAAWLVENHPFYKGTEWHRADLNDAGYVFVPVSATPRFFA
jgi:hypothetical protein